MTRFTLLAFALFASACATDIDTNTEDTTDGFRSSLEDIDTDTERRATRQDQQLVREVLNEYGPLARQYDCEIVAVVSAKWKNMNRIKGAVLDVKGNRLAVLNASMRERSRNAGAIIGSTQKSRLNDTEYQMRGLFDRTVIEADFTAVTENGNAEGFDLFADWSRKGARGMMKGVIADCS